MRHAITKEANRNSLKEFVYFQKYLGEEGNAKMNILWREGEAFGLPGVLPGNQYFGGYEICAIGVQNFVAPV